jgi:hypothetical protein
LPGEENALEKGKGEASTFLDFGDAEDGQRTLLCGEIGGFGRPRGVREEEKAVEGYGEGDETVDLEVCFSIATS